ncbi:hypothetical protein HSRCO_0754 [Halanaeroarchaeum sp. HSR-CO]|uniref:hypothetical protein n=1 Tax=Halanaeroarchaeum sp. HSR-CO TaxID=2866382 RepID=UPI00217DFBA1|nr:hypothetical protein [Halanaeroarchaeum sp. HSR-CO]UWG47048.1 hypothetical protein HSRCO_0754 [Halanaeroarchaeum sp. HSR-CO]
MTENEPDAQKRFVDQRPKQESLIKEPERPEKESRIDRGGSEQFADDRIDVDENEDPGDQSALTGDFNQKTLDGGRAGPEWFDE